MHSIKEKVQSILDGHLIKENLVTRYVTQTFPFLKRLFPHSYYAKKHYLNWVNRLQKYLNSPDYKEHQLLKILFDNCLYYRKDDLNNSPVLITHESDRKTEIRVYEDGIDFIYGRSRGTLKQQLIDNILQSIDVLKYKGLAKAYLKLRKNNLWNEVSFNYIKDSYDILSLTDALIVLKKSGIAWKKTLLQKIKADGVANRIKEALRRLATNNLLSEPLVHFLCEQDFSCEMAAIFADLVILLHKANLLNQKNLTFLKNQNKNPICLLQIISRLSRQKLLNQSSFDGIKEHPEIKNLSMIIDKLENASLLSINNLQSLLEKKYAFLLSDKGCHLFMERFPTHILSQANFTQLLNSLEKENADIALHLSIKAIVKNYYTQIPTVEADKLLSSIIIPKEVKTEAISILQEAGLLKKEYIELIYRHPTPKLFAKTLYFLRRRGLLNQTNIDALLCLNFRGLDIISKCCCVLDITKGQFNALLHPNHYYLLTVDAYNGIWARLPKHLLTPTVFNALMERANATNPQIRLRLYIDWLLREQNPNQSTHTKSVHQSSSESALKLYNRYQSTLNHSGVMFYLNDIKRTLESLPKNHKTNAALRCLTRMRGETGEGEFVDPNSKVSINQLFVLFWLAINDQKTRLANFEDGMNQFIEALYEIQREYNLSEEGQDDGKEDRPSCPSGAFNKLIEKLESLHPDAVLYYITKTQASDKLQFLVKKQTTDYLNKLQAEKPQVVETLIKDIEQEGVMPIWEKIKPVIKDLLFDEFKSLWEEDNNNPDFLALIEQGLYTDIEPIIQGVKQRQSQMHGGGAGAPCGLVESSPIPALDCKDRMFQSNSAYKDAEESKESMKSLSP